MNKFIHCWFISSRVHLCIVGGNSSFVHTSVGSFCNDIKLTFRNNATQRNRAQEWMAKHDRNRKLLWIRSSVSLSLTENMIFINMLIEAASKKACHTDGFPPDCTNDIGLSFRQDNADRTPVGKWQIGDKEMELKRRKFSLFLLITQFRPDTKRANQKLVNHLIF